MTDFVGYFRVSTDWQGIWAVMAETPVDMAMLMMATPIALLVQFWDSS